MKTHKEHRIARVGVALTITRYRARLLWIVGFLQNDILVRRSFQFFEVLPGKLYYWKAIMIRESSVFRIVGKWSKIGCILKTLCLAVLKIGADNVTWTAGVIINKGHSRLAFRTKCGLVRAALLIGKSNSLVVSNNLLFDRNQAKLWPMGPSRVMVVGTA